VAEPDDGDAGDEVEVAAARVVHEPGAVAGDERDVLPRVHGEERGGDDSAHACTAVSPIDAEEAGKLLDAGAFQGGIIPKLRAAITAAQLGVRAEIGSTAVVA